MTTRVMNEACVCCLTLIEKYLNLKTMMGFMWCGGDKGVRVGEDEVDEVEVANGRLWR